MIYQKNESKNKGVAPVIGFFLIVALLTLAGAQYQNNVVPINEQEAEAEHFSDVVNSMSEIRNDILATGGTDDVYNNNIETTVDYSSFSLVPPPNNRGTLSAIEYTDDDGEPIEIEIDNAVNDNEASNFWTGETRSYRTSYINYDISYDRFQENPELGIEHGFLYRANQVDEDEFEYIPESDQRIINDRSINIVALSAPESSESGTYEMTVSDDDSTTIESHPVSAPATSISIENDDDEQIELSLPSNIPAEVWEDQILVNELEDNGGYIENIEQESDNIVTISLLDETIYNLRLSRAHLLTGDDRNIVPQTETEYVSQQTGAVNIREGEQIDIEAEARDKYNNGVLGQPVIAEAQDIDTGECYGDYVNSGDSSLNTRCNNTQDFLQPGQQITNEDGEANFVYEAPETDTDRNVSFSLFLEEE